MIEDVWDRIKTYEGQMFKQKKGKEFSYSIKGNILFLKTTNRSITKKVVEQALKLVPLESTVPVQHLQAPSYLYGILMDDRVRGDKW
ncbi:hypothetical protein [Domibacillus enclensis]|uniref:Uncharacterized protein n=1 Tax=Domibacillus enclensis TaxID=1017273 RepID=A0A1N6TM09_9BACI|nr:hypothetical protein [Domibacillus enclensis]OXS78310.1 hypothetical protein B1B05_06755 [Domibacillus enclensis]SIQ54287.1 hypothetical protein SAMN05443094_10321 [Domibacillus enclensis]